jgi:hypothetical protein
MKSVKSTVRTEAQIFQIIEKIKDITIVFYTCLWLQEKFFIIIHLVSPLYRNVIGQSYSYMTSPYYARQEKIAKMQKKSENICNDNTKRIFHTKI